MQIIFILVLLYILFIPKEKKPKEKICIEGFNEYETELIRRFKNHIDSTNFDGGKRIFAMEDNIICLYMPTNLDVIDVDKVKQYVVLNQDFRYYIDEINMKYNKDCTQVRWYKITFSRKFV